MANAVAVTSVVTSPATKNGALRYMRPVLGVRRHSKASDAMLEHKGVRRLDPRPTRYFLQVRKTADEAERHESETLCAFSRKKSRLTVKRSKCAGTPAG